jgi:hypothetical protein
MMYVRYSLSLRQVEALLFERGIDVSMQASTTSATASPGTCSVRLDRRIEGRQLPFDAVRERIAVSSVSNTAQTHGQGHEPALVNGVRLI